MVVVVIKYWSMMHRGLQCYRNYWNYGWAYSGYSRPRLAFGRVMPRVEDHSNAECLEPIVSWRNWSLLNKWCCSLLLISWLKCLCCSC